MLLLPTQTQLKEAEYRKPFCIWYNLFTGFQEKIYIDGFQHKSYILRIRAFYIRRNFKMKWELLK